MTQEDPPRLSPELQAAQARLLQLRAERRQAANGHPPDGGCAAGPTACAPRAVAPEAPNWLLINARKELLSRRAALAAGTPPPPRSTAALLPLPGSVPGRPPGSSPPAASPAPARHPDAPSPGSSPLNYANQPGPQLPTDERPPAAATIPVHPTLLMAVLRHNQAAPARVWLLLRHGDAAGNGRHDLDDIRRLLTGAGAPLRCCGSRRLRQLLAAGEGLFWRRDDRGRLWLAAAHKVAHALDCGRMQGAPVDLPVAALLGGIHNVRAAFYAAFHSGRPAAPISRDTLAALSGVAARTQLEYDRAARVGRRRNVAVGERYSDERFRERAWERGRAVFRFIDTAGQQGRPGGRYVAWHLPNSYEGPYPRRAAIGRKRLNRKLADLVIKGTPGNGERAAERVFWPDGAAAARSYNRGPDHDAYWQRETPAGRPRVWNVMAGQGGAARPAGGRCSTSFPACGGRKKNAS